MDEKQQEQKNPLDPQEPQGNIEPNDVPGENELVVGTKGEVPDGDEFPDPEELDISSAKRDPGPLYPEGEEEVLENGHRQSDLPEYTTEQDQTRRAAAGAILSDGVMTPSDLPKEMSNVNKESQTKGEVVQGEFSKAEVVKVQLENRKLRAKVLELEKTIKENNLTGSNRIKALEAENTRLSLENRKLLVGKKD